VHRRPFGPRSPRPLEPVPDPEPLEPEPGADTNVVQLGVGRTPRRWNLWDLERLDREHEGDEERTFILMYLRDFAGPDGLLPADFDGLVRESFGALVGAR
jgi:hypothetical protein